MRAVLAVLVVLPALALAGCMAGAPIEAASIGDAAPPLPPAEWEHLLAQPRFEGRIAESHVVASLDGDTDLSVELYLPDGFGDERLPTMLVLSPYHAVGYGKDADRVDAPGFRLPWVVDHFTTRGYAVALADMRGTRNSAGCFDFGGRGDQEDGHALVQWIAAQPWSNGKVGMWGVSHVGMSQLATAVSAPPNLTTVVPIAAISSFWRYLYFGGVHYDLNMATPPAYTAVATAPPTGPVGAGLVRNLADTGCDAPYHNLKGTSQDGRMDAHWLERDYPSMAANVTASVFLVHGFVDQNVKMDHADAMWRALVAEGRVPVKAWFGQWGHSEPNVEEWPLHLQRWMDHWLLGIDTGVLAEPRVTLQDSTGAWRNVSDWPPPGARALELHLAPDGLQPEPSAEGAASWRDVPGTTRGREPPGTFLRFAAEAFDEDVRVVGTPRLVLDTSSDEASTHWAFLLYEEDAGGRLTLWDRGYLDSRQRERLDGDEALRPGERVVVTIDAYPVDHVLRAGHRLVLHLTSSDGCGYVVQPVLTGCGPAGVVSDTTAATNTVHFGGADPTRLVLPVAE